MKMNKANHLGLMKILMTFNVLSSMIILSPVHAKSNDFIYVSLPAKLSDACQANSVVQRSSWKTVGKVHLEASEVLDPKVRELRNQLATLLTDITKTVEEHDIYGALSSQSPSYAISNGVSQLSSYQELDHLSLLIYANGGAKLSRPIVKAAQKLKEDLTTKNTTIETSLEDNNPTSSNDFSKNWIAKKIVSN